MSRRKVKIILGLILIFLIWRTCFRQRAHWPGVDDRGLFVQVDQRASREDLLNLFYEIGLDLLDPDSLFLHEDLGIYAEQGWSLERKSAHIIELRLPFTSGDNWVPKGLMADLARTEARPQEMHSYGVNRWLDKDTKKRDHGNGQVRFYLEGFTDRESVYLSGSFNDWSTVSHPMQRMSSGWELSLDLAPGRYAYKYLVDDFQWMEDPLNALSETDTYGGKYSVLFVENHLFRLEGYDEAREVFVAGSFNNWNGQELALSRKSSTWELPIFLKEGTHAYKFVIDGRWEPDPTNPVRREDGRGNVNSFVGIGDTLNFRLNGFTQAGDVFLAGSFNMWNFSELRMLKNEQGWELPYVLPPGNYEYKFKVDNLYIPDPDNPHSSGSGHFMNSVLMVSPNVRMSLKGFNEAKYVAISGDFNHWNHQGYLLEKQADGWGISLFLSPGKLRYKYIVDGEWILDPGNPFYEENEFGTGNSLLWVRQ